MDSPQRDHERFQPLIEHLRHRTGATRTTLRLDRPEGVFPVVAESLAEGAESIATATSIDLLASPTFKFLDERRRNLIQEDVPNAEVAPPPGLIAVYGVKAQMLAPVVVDDRLVGIVSVHYAPSTRVWTDGEVAALDEVAAAVTAALSTPG